MIRMKLEEIKDIEGLRGYCYSERQCSDCKIRKNGLDGSQGCWAIIPGKNAEETLGNIIAYNRRKKLEKLLS